VRVVVCPDKLRGSLSAAGAVAAITAGLTDAGVSDVLGVPMADGGEGTLDVLLAATGGERRTCRTVDALGGPVTADWGVLPDGTAVVEAATSIGLALLGTARDPVGASSAGLGAVVTAALDSQPRQLLVAVGGSATTDGGLGCLDAIGWDLRGVPTTVATDVTTTFVAAAATYAPQKGADAAQVAALTARLERLADRYAREHRDVREMPGSGAAGGLAGGLAAIGAELRPGFDVVAATVGLPQLVAPADAVLTAEGRLDATSLDGKVVGGVLHLAGRGRRVAVLAGTADDDTASRLRADGVTVRTLRELATDEEESFRDAGRLLRLAAAAAAAEVRGPAPPVHGTDAPAGPATPA
jgi:glycerate kinase